MNQPTRYAAVWRSCLALLAVSGATGVLFRLFVLGQVQVPWPLVFIRHAHSHAVLFGWAIPALLLALAVRHRPSVLRSRGLGVLFATNQLLALASWPLFLGWGYGDVAIGSASLPLPAIVSGMVMFAWYAWCGLWATSPAPDDSSPIGERFATTALLFLVLASFGAWGVAAAQALGHGERVTGFLTHTFLHLLSLGFLGVGACSLLIPRDLSTDRAETLNVALRLIGLGIPLSVPYTSLHVDVPTLRIIGRAGLFAVAAGGFLVVSATWRVQAQKLLPRFFLLARSGSELLLAAVPTTLATLWTQDHSLRILYLHVSMVGLASIAIVDTVAAPGRATRVLRWSLAALPLSLVPISSFAPAVLRGGFGWWLAVGAGVAVTLVSAWCAFAPRSSRKAVGE